MTIYITWKRVLAALLAVLLASLCLAWSGLFPVAASSGHWAVTDWFLHWTMRNSVRTYAALGPSPVMPAEKGLVSAAGHYRQACQVCHGAPGIAPSPVMQKATPPAPDLAKLGDKWSDRQLAWIIQHGVKMTGMPAWGAPDRPDEVGRMVAFVRRMPGMTASEYRTLTEDASVPSLSAVRPAVLAACTGCHGTDGRGRGQADIPVLGGQNPAYLRAALMDYAAGRRHSAVMQTAVTGLTSRQMAALARHFAALPGLAASPAQSTNRLVMRGAPDRQLPACISCHAPGKPHPVLRGQKPAYVAARLRRWRGDETIIDARKSPETMAMIARRIPEDQIDAVARAVSAPPVR